jgi:predicted O-methyltransferase YrrM
MTLHSLERHFMSNRTINLTDTVYQYLKDVSLREPDVLRHLREETAKLPQARMQISPEQGQLMALLIKLMGAKRILELGTFTGYSALVMALALPADGKLIACDVDEETTAIAKRYWREAGVAEKMELKIAPALETMSKLADGCLDVVFIDADKGEYPQYYQEAMRLLVPGGLILVDNSLRGGHVADMADQSDETKAIRRVLETAHSDERVDVSLLPVGDGLLLARKR